MAPKPPTKGAAPAMEDDDDTGMDASDGNQGTDDEEAEPGDEGEGGAEGEVIATILKNPDGSFTLIHGDEDDGAEGEGGEEPEEGEDESGEEGEGGEHEGSYRETYHTEGELLKGVLDCIRADKGEDESADEHDFQGGFDEDKEPTPAAGKPKPVY